MTESGIIKARAQLAPKLARTALINLSKNTTAVFIATQVHCYGNQL